MSGIKTRQTNKRKSIPDLQGKQTKKSHKSSVTDDLEEALKNLQIKYDSLLSENKINLEKIAILEKKINSIEKNERIFLCEECEYPADNLCELGEHMYEYHKYEDSVEVVYCNYCNMKFENKNKLMVHRKNDHEDRINMCRYFLKDRCAFDNQTCWYSHKNLNESAACQEIKEYICSVCEDKFIVKSELMQHKKIHHPKNIQICSKNKTDSCHFGDKCWFKHEEKIDETMNDNTMTNENIEKLFQILEQFTERIIKFENQAKI